MAGGGFVCYHYPKETNKANDTDNEHTPANDIHDNYEYVVQEGFHRAKLIKFSQKSAMEKQLSTYLRSGLL